MRSKKINVGGQAVIEGVMIRGERSYCVAVRKKNRIIVINGKIKKKNALLRLPVIRGFINLAEMLLIGTKSLVWSAEQVGGSNQKASKNEISVTILISLIIAVLFFIALPYALTGLIGFKEESNPFLFNSIDGIFRITVFLVYLASISFVKDVRTLFQYHGAEHKAIHCYEHGEKITVKNVRRFTTLHPRCGTSFLIAVFALSIMIFSFLPSTVIYLFPNFSGLSLLFKKAVLFPLRIALIPIIAGLSYEFIRITDKKKSSLVFKAISMPGLWLQKITTKEPSIRQIETAIRSLKNLLKLENKK